jgi:Uma2 family endonuclease
MTSIRQDLKFTYEDYLLLPEDKRYELVDGDLYMMPSPRTYHQIVCAQIELKLRQFVEKKKLGIILHAPCDVYFSRYDVVQPDILFVAHDRRGTIKERYVQGPPDLVVEALSPSEPERDREIKRKLYARYGVLEYWIVDPDAKSIELLVRRLGAFVGKEKLTSPVLKGFKLSLAAAFKNPIED